MLYALIAVNSLTWVRAASMGALEVAPTARRALLVLVCLLASVALMPPGITQAAPPAQSPEEGKAEFLNRCVSCHTIGGGVLIGPDLEGVAQRREESWLKAQISGDFAAADENDPTVVTNRKIYGLQMPDLRLDEEIVENLITYLETDPKLPTVIPAQYAPTLAAGALVIIGLTVLGLWFGTKRVEVRL